jgi:hypothetical protein
LLPGTIEKSKMVQRKATEWPYAGCFGGVSTFGGQVFIASFLKFITMAKLKGIIKIEGTLQDMTFYKTQDGHLVKTKSGVSGNRIANDAAFARTRENGAEFGSAAKAGKLLRNCTRVLIKSASDNRVTSRVTQMMYRIQLEDTTSPRGQRKVSVGIATPQGQDLVKSFNFNDKSVLGSILHKPYSVDTATGVITIADFTPLFDVEAVAGATHVKFAGAFASVNFETGESEIQYTNEEDLPIDETVTQITLTPVAVPTVVGTHFFPVGGTLFPGGKWDSVFTE